MTSSEIKYLLALRELSKNNAQIKSIDIAAKLHYTRSSVSRMRTKFEQMKLVEKEPNRSIKVTDKGFKLASKMRKLIAFLSKELHHKLDCSYAMAQKDAINMVGVLSKRNLENMYIAAVKNQCLFDSE